MKAESRLDQTLTRQHRMAVSRDAVLISRPNIDCTRIGRVSNPSSYADFFSGRVEPGYLNFK
ncbi:hypothetical protein QV65_04550 [Rhodococcus erythropolis]|nr:hypothetical protein QV65_04550 [Rhodococcus erythropolis]